MMETLEIKHEGILHSGIDDALNLAKIIQKLRIKNIGFYIG